MNQSDNGFLKGGDAILVQIEMTTEPTCDIFLAVRIILLSFLVLTRIVHFHFSRFVSYYFFNRTDRAE